MDGARGFDLSHSFVLFLALGEPSSPLNEPTLPKACESPPPHQPGFSPPHRTRQRGLSSCLASGDFDRLHRNGWPSRRRIGASQCATCDSLNRREALGPGVIRKEPLGVAPLFPQWRSTCGLNWLTPSWRIPIQRLQLLLRAGAEPHALDTSGQVEIHWQPRSPRQKLLLVKSRKMASHSRCQGMAPPLRSLFQLLTRTFLALMCFCFQVVRELLAPRRRGVQHRLPWPGLCSGCDV